MSDDTETLREENRKLKAALDAQSRVAQRALASYQQQVLQMELIRQQNDDLDRLAADLHKAKQLAEDRARESESAARLQREFLANFSHEIRTPLNGILGYCDLLLREEGERLTPHGRRDLGIIKANARTLLSLINDILDLSKIEAGHVDVTRERAELKPILEECAATVRQVLRGKDVELVVKCQVEQVFTDALKLRQILLNLLSNAAKFTDSGEIVITLAARGATLVITVEDTGHGIPADQLERIFEKFRQVDGSSTRRAGGTGLGLAIVRQLCKLLGGSIEVSSVLGRGSTFTVTLPDCVSNATTSGPGETPGAPESAPELVRGVTVVVIDDDLVLQHLLRAQLEAEGFRVVTVSDGSEALATVREHRPETIILDLHLPVISGWKLLTQLKSDPELSRIHVIILSVEDERARGYSLGACDYLVKPVETVQVVEVVKRAVTPASGEVLVVDDDAATRELVCRSLTRIGFSTAEAASGDEALLRMRVAPPVLVVLDLLMPGMSGLEVLYQMRAEGRDTPVVVLTGKALTSDEQRVLRTGFAQIVQKGGFAIDQVVCEAKRALMQRRDQSTSKRARVLYVEDSAQNRDIVRRYLHGLFELYEAEDGEQGFDRALQHRPDLILMDLSLPRVDGWEVTRRLKQNALLRDIPVIALSAHASTEDMLLAREAGCAEYLTKPISSDELLGALRKHLSQAHPLGARAP